jgi:maltose/moltooligosaccharide transporter
MYRRPSLSFWQIINMNVGFFGIQYSFGLQQTAINPLYSFLNARPEELPLLNLAGPVTGLLIQPLIGAMSDRTWSPRWGRRKPYFLIGAIGCSICLFLFPFSRELWMAVGLLWILDAANNTAMEPYRAFIADQLPAEQRPTGFLTQSFFTGLGITLANLSLFGFQKLWGGTELTAGDGIPQWVYGSFFFGAICSIGSVWYSMATTPEVSPDPAEIERIKGLKTGVAESVKEIFSAFRDMPAIMWRLALVYLFQWYAMFCYWQFISHGIAKSIWKTTAELNPSSYAEAVGWTGLINGFYNVITFISAFGLIWLVKKSNPRVVHAFCLFWAAAGLLSIPFIENKYLLFFPMIGLGVAWASMMGVPYLLVMDYLPKERFGVYTGIVNMMIVVPMIIQTLTFGWIYGRFLGGDPTLAVGFSGVLLMAAGFLTLRVKP